MKVWFIALLAVFLSSGLARAAGYVVINDKGTSNADITVDGTTGGVAVADAKTTRRGGTISNTGTANMECGPASITVTASVGKLIKPGETAVYGSEFQEAWKCIRTTSTSTTANVQEAF